MHHIYTCQFPLFDLGRSCYVSLFTSLIAAVVTLDPVNNDRSQLNSNPFKVLAAALGTFSYWVISAHISSSPTHYYGTLKAPVGLFLFP